MGERVVLATKVKMTTTMKMMGKMTCLVLAVLLVLAAVVEIRAQEDPLQVSSEVVSPATATSEVQKIEMTAPVLASVIPGDGPFCEENFTYHFYLPREFQTNPPKPTEESVTNTKLPPLRVAVASYGGWSNEREVITNGRALFETLSETTCRLTPR